MKYFFDTEFIEGFSKWTFAKNRHFVDLISIGIISEDGRQYYAISNEFNPDDASQWVKDNVLYPIMVENGFSKNLSNLHGCLSYSKSAIKSVQKNYGKSNKQIAQEIIDFVNPNITDLIYKFTRHDCWAEQFYKEEFAYIKKHNTKIPETYYKSGVAGDGYKKNAALIFNQPEFYAYYADYDWVVFCSLFGTMMQLPNGFPMYCRDLKQSFDEMVENIDLFKKEMNDTERSKFIKEHAKYPKQKNEHNALADAKWNKELYEFMGILK